LRIALLVYRGNPRSGGQGVYVRHLSRELTALGHRVTVFSGRPYPELAEGVELERVPSLDLYRDVDPFRTPHPREIEGLDDLVELATMWTGGFAEPRTFARRAREHLRSRRGEFDIVHDDQGLGRGLLRMIDDGWPVIASSHQPVTIDRSIDLSEAEGRRRLTLRRWYGFAAMQSRVARRIDRVLTVSDSSKRDIVSEMGVDPSRIAVVPIGVDDRVFSTRGGARKVPGRIVTTASADVALKGLGHLFEALAKLRSEDPRAHLVVIGHLRKDSLAARTIARLGIERAVTFVSGPSDDEIASWYRSASVVVVPSLYEGFSLPAVEAMACGAPLVATTGGALPEVVGADGETGILVPPADASALALGVARVFDDPAGAAAMAERGRARVAERFSWNVTASRTVEEYHRVLEGRRC
jgi:glycosyltransferase involved in cell wall biosynthesis